MKISNPESDEIDNRLDWQWDGVDISEVKSRIDFFYEYNHSKFKELKITVPDEISETVKYIFHQDPYNSENRKEIHFQIVAVDKSGMALIDRTQYYSYEDVEVPNFSVVALNDAIAMHNHYTERNKLAEVKHENDQEAIPKSKKYRPI